MSTASHAQPTGIPAKPSPLTTQVWATVRLATIFAGVYLAQGALLRLILWGFFGQEAGLRFSALPSVLGLGSIRDLDAALYLFLPLLVLSLLAPRRLLASRFGRVAFACGSFAFLFALVYLGFLEYFYFEEFSSRFDIVSVDYLLYPHEVLVNIWESYPVLPILMVTAASSALLLRWLWPTISRALDGLARSRGLRGSMVTAVAVALLIVQHGGYGYFDNMNHFFASNGFEIHDRSSLPEPRFANIWGVSDEDLFAGALDTFDNLSVEGSAEGQPFFGVVLTTSITSRSLFRKVCPESRRRVVGVSPASAMQTMPWADSSSRPPNALGPRTLFSWSWPTTEPASTARPRSLCTATRSPCSSIGRVPSSPR